MRNDTDFELPLHYLQYVNAVTFQNWIFIIIFSVWFNCILELEFFLEMLY
jgi:hypothetical protein